MYSKNPCPDCGPAPTIHILDYYSVIIDRFTQKLFRPIDSLRQRLARILPSVNAGRFVLALWKLLSFLHIGRIVTEPDDQVGHRGLWLWKEAQKRGIALIEYRLGRSRDFFVASYGEKVIAFQGLPRPTGKEYASLEWMDNKAEMRKRFAAAGIPVARGGDVRTWHQAVALFRTLHKPVITKPSIGSRGRHATTRIMTEADLKIGFDKAKLLSPWVIVEEEFLATLHRVTVIGGRVIGVLRRDRACIIGDGTRTIRDLVAVENRNPHRDGPLFQHIETGEEASEELRLQNLSWDSIPPKGQWIGLSKKPSRSVGGSTMDILDETHPANIALFEKIARVLDDPLIGIDFFIEDMSQPWQEQTYAGVIECNSCPFIDLHHEPLYGPVRNAGGALWSIIFPDQGAK
ncbi:MAG: hypothetical protein A3A33_04695 [Candidatus Yanofskybacteria bacterium RIFCSPLOWO2_01_FULL_49_25]|uniref:ATP-grasp domain-containing protein n=1 Tax=Candidatus Yanofskybacteria bacterium RIFCSPLOWO2_01_FULL_49_25 TaxID=1802701 RepID=A0A1F8GQ18_9BACT|nr:MAG: hypothetical protein A3A33_04695 [Candidatus Yanofskybacteria bacterium RIFCSPLOWO2_01_FULL_49_25]